MKLKSFALVAALAFAPSLLLAQPPTSPQTRQTTGQRKTDQQGRIAQGAGSGELTARETGHLEHQEAGINREERGMRAQDNGHLTKQDRSTLRSQQNQESRRIYRDKHNSRVR